MIRVRGTAVTAGDVELRSLRLPFWLKLAVRMLMGPVNPRGRVLGQEFSGEIAEVGSGVTAFRPGDQVFGTTGFAFGAYAEYLCLPLAAGGGALATKPINLSHAEAATIPTGGLEALHLMGKAGDLLQRRVLIIGAAGGIGAVAVQLAKAAGARVTGVDSALRLELPRRLGADRLIDYDQEDFAQRGERYDVIFDTVGKASFRRCLSSLSDGGFLLLGNPGLWGRIRSVWGSRPGRKRLIVGAAVHRAEDLDRLRQLVETGKIRATIAREYPLNEVANAHRYFESGQAVGSVAIRVGSSPVA